ncbi:MAG: P1 family peptidase [Candidatus Bathyarchaeota archaeon]|nr:P1 family peptidase [Candidatus Bathyarchaeota archaeon]
MVIVSPKKRARDLGIPINGEAGHHNAITDVKGVMVGHSTIISGEGKLVPGKGPVRTGVTAILPRGEGFDPVFAGWSSLNGNGEMTGTTWVEESGFLEGPVMITNTHSVGIVHNAVIEWILEQRMRDPDLTGAFWSLPVVAETYDGRLNDTFGFHVKKTHAFEALNNVKQGPVEEGNVGGGTGMTCHQFKGGIGTSSRTLIHGGYTVGVLVQANYGSRELLTIAGVPVGMEITDLMPEIMEEDTHGGGSIIVVVATDAPLLPHQLKRLARRVPMGISKVGGIASNGSGDIFIAFSTANQGAWTNDSVTMLNMLSNDRMTDLFLATVQATEEAIVNALIAAETMTGINGNTVHALPHDRLRETLRKYNRLIK